MTQTHAIEKRSHVAVGIDDGRVAAKLHHAPDKHDALADVRVEVGRGDARG